MSRSRLFAAVAGALVLIAAIYSLALAPKAKQVRETKAKVEDARQKEASLNATLKRLRSLSQQRPARQAELQRLAAAVPPKADLAGFIVSADKLALDSGVDWVSVSPTPPSGGNPAIISLSIQIQGGFFQVLDYLNRLEHLERVVVTDNVQLSSTGTGVSPTITVTLSARMFTTAAATRGASAGASVGATTTTVAGATPSTTATTRVGAP